MHPYIILNLVIPSLEYFACNKDKSPLVFHPLFMDLPGADADRATIDEYLFSVHQTLFEGTCTAEYLIQIHPFIEPHHWQAIQQERASQQLCGYPLCGESLKPPHYDESHQRISLKDRRVWRISDRGPFCSVKCQGKAQMYGDSLNSESIWLRWSQIIGKRELAVKEREIVDKMAHLNTN